MVRRRGRGPRATGRWLAGAGGAAQRSAKPASRGAGVFTRSGVFTWSGVFHAERGVCDMRMWVHGELMCSRGSGCSRGAGVHGKRVFMGSGCVHHGKRVCFGVWVFQEERVCYCNSDVFM